MLSRPNGTPDTAEGADEEASNGPTTPSVRGYSLGLLQRGFWINMSNPKAIVFILAFMPQFIRPELAQLPQYFIFALTMVIVGIAVMWGGFALIARSLTKLSASPSGQHLINLLFGSLFIAVAALLILATR